MRYGELKQIIRSDLYRYSESQNSSMLINSVWGEPGFKYTFWMRACTYLKGIWVLRRTLFYLSAFLLGHYKFKYGIVISPNCTIGPGLYIGHFGGIVVHPDARIGKNCNISHGVTIGQSNRGSRKGVPVIGDNVYIGPGAKILGCIHIGDDVAIGANSVVTKDIADHAVVIGIPGKVISYRGAQGYVNRVLTN
jgi:serine O-acetyltransferase